VLAGIGISSSGIGRSSAGIGSSSLDFGITSAVKNAAAGANAGWQLDQGDGNGRQWYRDDTHVFQQGRGDLVVAAGRNAFAPFVAAGVLSGYSYRIDKKNAGSKPSNPKLETLNSEL